MNRGSYLFTSVGFVATLLVAIAQMVTMAGQPPAAVGPSATESLRQLSEAIVWQPESGTASTAQKFVLLTNGNVLQGQVLEEQAGLRLVVERGEIFLPRNQVEAVCDTLEQCYRKRATAVPNDAQGHLNLALWCLRVGLTKQAQHELEIGRALCPSHPMVKLVEKQIELAQFKPQQLAPKQQTKESPPKEHLHQLAESLPPELVQQFTRTIQPLLINRCATAGCHSSRGRDGFRLWRIFPNERPNRNITQRNLAEVLAQIDWDNPEQSPLITKPIELHGGLNSPVFLGPHDPLFRELAGWLYGVVGASSKGVSGAPISTPRTPSQQTIGGAATTPPFAPNVGFGAGWLPAAVPQMAEQGSKNLPSPTQMSAPNQLPYPNPIGSNLVPGAFSASEGSASAGTTRQTDAARTPSNPGDNAGLGLWYSGRRPAIGKSGMSEILISSDPPKRGAQPNYPIQPYPPVPPKFQSVPPAMLGWQWALSQQQQAAAKGSNGGSSAGAQAKPLSGNTPQGSQHDRKDTPHAIGYEVWPKQQQAVSAPPRKNE